MNISIDVALIVWNTDVIDLLSMILDDRQLRSSGIEPSRGERVIEEFIATRSPSVVIFDLHPPYDQSAAVALGLMDQFADRSFVITCADRKGALKAAPWLRFYPLFQKPYAPDEIADTVRSLVKRSFKGAAAVSVGA
jgi:hypothetical protein